MDRFLEKFYPLSEQIVSEHAFGDVERLIDSGQEYTDKQLLEAADSDLTHIPMSVLPQRLQAYLPWALNGGNHHEISLDK